MPGFELSKWYADVITDDGSSAILYHAVLRWRAVTLHYSSLLTHTASDDGAQFSLRRASEPSLSGDTIAWNSEALHVSGTWSALGESRRNLLYTTDEGSLDWNCIAPRAEAELRIGDQPPMRGWGYVEHLKLTLPPWHLPIKRLRWGRFVNATDAMVWIDWEGAYTTRVVYLNGNPVETAVLNDREIVLADRSATLHLEDSRVLRDGQLGTTALAIIPYVEKLFPASILRARECKWLSRATLRRPGLPDTTGLAIHEVVEWP